MKYLSLLSAGALLFFHTTSLTMPLSDTHHAGLGTAVHVPKFIILVVWAQCSVAKLVFWFGSCLENLELEFAQPI